MKIKIQLFLGNVQVAKIKENGNVKLENQVCSLELSKKLKELGVKQESLFYWVRPVDKWLLTPVITDEDKIYLEHSINDVLQMEHYSAFTVAELGNMLPNWTKTIKRLSDDWVCIVRHKHNDINNHAFSDTEANCRSKMLIYLIENKLMDVLK